MDSAAKEVLNDPTSKIRNAMQLKKAIYDHVVSGSRDSAWSVLRKHDDDIKVILGNPNNNDKVAAIEKVEAGWRMDIEDATWRGPLAQSHLDLGAAEIGLAGEVLACIDELELDNPRDVRDAVQAIGRLNKQVADHSLNNAIEILEGAGHSCAVAMRQRFDDLFPKDNDDE